MPTPFIRDIRDDRPSLEGLARAGDIILTDNNYLVCIDLTVRRSGITLYATGDTVSEAVDELWNELADHMDALDHLEGLGVDARDVAHLVSYDEFDPSFAPAPLDPAYTRPPVNSELPSDVYDIAAHITQVPTAPVAAAAGEPIDTDSSGYILALLIPVVIGRA